MENRIEEKGAQDAIVSAQAGSREVAECELGVTGADAGLTPGRLVHGLIPGSREGRPRPLDYWAWL